MKKINKILAGGFLLLTASLVSCKKDFQEINTSVNSLNDTRPEFLFTSATLDYSMRSRSHLLSRFSNAMRHMQYIVGDNIDKDAMEAPYCDPTKTNFPNPVASLYGDYFGSTGRDYRRVIDKIGFIEDGLVKSGYKNLSAIASIMETYDAWKLADAYGALPYSQAFNVALFPVPKYDYDYDLYLTFDKQLKDAVNVLVANPTNQKDISKQDFF